MLVVDYQLEDDLPEKFLLYKKKKTKNCKRFNFMVRYQNLKILLLNVFASDEDFVVIESKDQFQIVGVYSSKILIS